MRLSRIRVAFIMLALVMILPPANTAKAADTGVAAALKTAIFHASELAQKGTVVDTSLLHVQHVMNCLEGPNGKNYKAAAGFPCQGQGGGIIPDLTAAAGSGARGAEAALRNAKVAWNLCQQALSMKSVNEVQPYASVVAVYLQRALNAIQ